MTPPLSSPRDRSNFARKAAHARWSKENRHCERSEAISSPKRTAELSWLTTRFCLSLHQDSALAILASEKEYTYALSNSTAAPKQVM